MSVLVDTSVWSLALRRDAQLDNPHVVELRRLLVGGDLVVTTGLIIQELLQGFVPERTRGVILERFASVPVVAPDRDDHVAAADLKNLCRSAGVQLGTIDALIARLAIAHGLTLLTADNDFVHAAPHVGLAVWTS
ncbi:MULTISPECIES: type II toxin-antitoxin system VapC family toxin [unclassified Gordonia (in: high G+C Gram-positive bacteria)]|uniref:type II toxin-antitoxin system VapC family toxin n=1 Tax=Gordonia sp. B7-2 TaxID=3420932 RepID=UPI003D8BB064